MLPSFGLSGCSVLAFLVLALLAGCGQNGRSGPESKVAHRPTALVLENTIEGTILAQKLSDPFGIASDNAGNIFLVDAGNNRLLRFDSDFQPIREAGGFGSSEGLLNSPTFIAVDNDLNLYVSDGGNQRISIFNARLNFVDIIDLIDPDDPLRFGRPSGLVVDDYGELWVSDPDNFRVSVFTSSFNFDRFVGDMETYSGLLLTPRAIAKDSDGRLIVSDEGRSSLYGFNSFGTYLFDFGKDILKKPSGLDHDQYGNIWVIDSEQPAILCFSHNGELLYSVGSFGKADHYSFNHPRDLTIMPGNRLAISDTGNDRILVYKILFLE